MFYQNNYIRGEGLIKYGVKHGVWKYFHKNGELLSVGEYIKERKHGIWKIFYDGTLMVNESFKYGLEDGIFEEIQIDGSFKIKGHYKNGKNTDLGWNFGLSVLRCIEAIFLMEKKTVFGNFWKR